jgi:hypothetical protein
VPNILTLDSDLRTITLEADSTHTVGERQIKLVIKLTNYPGVTGEKVFTVRVTECVPTILPSSAPSDVTYEVGTEAFTTTAFAPYSYTPSACSFTFTYSAQQSGGTALPSFITFDPAARTFSVETSNRGDASTYTVQIVATLNNGAATSNSERSFQIEIADNCNDDAVSLDAETGDLTYIIRSAATPTEVTPSFSHVHSQCPVSISITVDNSALLDSSPISFDPSSGKVTISTSDVATLDGESKTIAVTYTSTLSSGGSGSSSVTDTFVVTFRDPCHDTVVSAVTFPDDKTSYTFALWAQQSIPFNAAFESEGSCGTFTYSL